MDKLEAVFFDLDGTLINTLGDISNSYNKALEKFGLEPHSESDYKKFLGNGSYVLCQRLCGEQHKDKAEELNSIAMKIYRDNSTEFSYPYEGIEDAVEVLASRGVYCCLLSNKPDEITQVIMDDFFPKDRFALVSGLKDGKKAKPDVDYLLEMCKELDVDPKNCIFLGDSQVDIHTARNANMKAVVCNWGFRDRSELEEEKPDLIIEDTADIASLPEIFINLER